MTRPVVRLLRWVSCVVACVLLFGLASAGPGDAQQVNGLAAKRPILAGACGDCPWGIMGTVLKQALQPYGYDLQICYTCSRANNPRIVTGDVKMPPTDPENSPPPPVGNVDFGITSGASVSAAYQGILGYAHDGPRKNLRLIASIELPQYAMIAVKASSGITDLKQIKEKRLPVKILTSESPTNMPILSYYGITKAEIASWGGSYVEFAGTVPVDMDDFDIIVTANVYLGDAPEVRPFYLISARHSLRYLDLPEDLRDTMVKTLTGGYRKVDMPRSLFRGVDRPIKTVGISSQVIYSREDLPADFAYTVAKAMDEGRDLLRWVHMPLSYDSRSVTKLPPVPLHPGAERYYKEVGYLK